MMDKTSEKGRMNEMNEAIMKVARGDYSVQFELLGENDEIDSLAMGLNMMIDDVRKVEESLRESEERFRIASQIASDVVYERDLQTGIATFYGDIESHLGYEPGGYPRTMEGWREHVHPEDLARIEGQPMDKIQPGVPYGVEYRMRKKDGTYMTWSDRIVMVWDEKAGKPLKFIGTATNITERKQAEEALRGSREKIQRIFESVSDGITVTDLNGIITDVNEKALQLSGYNLKSDLVGKSAFESIASCDQERALNNMQRTVQQEEGGAAEFTLVRADGSEYPAEITVSVVKDTAGNPVGFISVIRDITERKRMEKELRDAQEKLIRSEKLAAIGQLAGGVGHELRNPLAAIKNAAYYIKGKVAKNELGQKEPRVMEFLDIVDDEINASNEIINDLLGFSHIGKPSVSPAKIEKVIEDALSRTPIPENIEVVKKLDADLPEVEIDPNQVHQVLVNIITNAVQAMPEGGKLTVIAREKGGFLEVEVADTGCGIPGESVDKIFDPLFTTKAKGIGLGLAVCKAIIDRHEGNIEVKSKVGKGTTFNVKLPLKREQNINIGGK